MKITACVDNRSAGDSNGFQRGNDDNAFHRWPAVALL